MRKKNHIDLFDTLTKFQQTILAHKPPATQMLEEVRMMRFKIRPVSGEITHLNFRNDQFIEMLWGLGKLDEFFQKHINDFNEKDKTIFFRIFDDLHRKFQDKFSKLQIAKHNPNQNERSGFEMEIFKEKSSIKN